MPLEEFRKAASKVDEAHKLQQMHIEKSAKKSALWYLFVFILVPMLVIGVPFLGYKGVTLVLESFQDGGEGVEGEKGVEGVEGEKGEAGDAGELRVTGVSDGDDVVSVILSDPMFRTYKKPIEGTLSAYNVTLQIMKETPDMPLAVNLIRGTVDSAFGAVYTSLGLAEIEGELTMSEGALGTVEVGTLLGQPIADPVTLEAKTQLLARIDNVLSLDPYAVVETGFNREETYIKYMRELVALQSVSQRVSEETSQETTALNDEIRKLTNEQKTLQEAFDKQTETLSTEGLSAQLERINQVSSLLLSKTGRYNVLTALLEMYDERLTTLELRIEAVEKNKEAIIKGVRVTPVEGSGVQLTN